jgi:hypothetical protein
MLPMISAGDTVRFVHAPPLGGVVSSVADGKAMVCMPICGSYQLRGPVALEDLEADRSGV